MPAPLLIDVSHTSHTRARTGIQRVVRSLRQELADAAVSVTYDPYEDAWRPLQPWEESNFTSAVVAPKRGARWPLAARLRGRWRRLRRRADRGSMPAGGLVVPELFSPAVGAALPRLLAVSCGPRIAVFHDAIALKYPELTPSKTVARFPGYLRELLQFDGIAAVSDDSREALIDYWRWLGVANPPAVQAIPLGVTVGISRPNAATTSPPVVLSIGSIEGRKNHLALLDACESVWAGGTPFTLKLIGLANQQTGHAALQRIETLVRAGRPIRYEGVVDDAAVAAAYAECRFTVYPSLMEGFGLPVFESLAHGKPCICSAQGALGEAAVGGGCVALHSVDANSLAAALKRLLVNEEELARLAREASRREFRTWADYVRDLQAWMRELKSQARGGV